MDEDIELVDSMTREVEDLGQDVQRSSEAPTIFLAPPILRLDDPKAYEPMMVSIGPYHDGKPELKSMQQLKLQFLRVHISATPDGSITEYLKMMKDLEPRARRCYSEEIMLVSDKFTKMMLLDGCFLVQILLPLHVRMQFPENKLRDTLWFHQHLIHDLLLVENQLPFFIVDRLLEALQIPEYVGFKKEILHYFKRILPRAMESPLPDEDLGIPEVHHLLHLFHSWYFKAPWKPNEASSCCNFLDQVCICCSNLPLSYLSPPQDEDQSVHLSLQNGSPLASIEIPELFPKIAGPSVPVKYIPCVTKLMEAGVKLKAKSTKTFLDVSFHEGVLEIPTIHVNGWTNPLFRNLIAFEQCCPKFGSVVTSFFVFMGTIINSSNDVKLLKEKGIIDSRMSQDKEVLCLFDNIGKNINGVADKDYLAHISVGVYNYSRFTWPRWRSKLVHNYFKSPLAVASFSAATLYFIIDLLQTIYTILYYQSTSKSN